MNDRTPGVGALLKLSKRLRQAYLAKTKGKVAHVRFVRRPTVSRATFNANFKLPGYTGGVTDTAAVQTYLQGKIGGAPSAIATVNSPGSGDGFQGTTSCPTPS